MIQGIQTKRVETRKVHIGSVDHALEILRAYNVEPAGRLHRAIGGTNLIEARVVAYAAARKVVAFLRRAVDVNVATSLGVEVAPENEVYVPTWVSQDGTVQPIAALPTQHLINILRKYDTGSATLPGIFQAVRRELRSRRDA